MSLPPSSGRPIAWDREETDSCEAGTPGCCIDHGQDEDPDSPCDTW